MGCCVSPRETEHALPETTSLPQVSNTQVGGSQNCSSSQGFGGNVVGTGGSTVLGTGISWRTVASVVNFEWPFHCLLSLLSPETERTE